MGETSSTPCGSLGPVPRGEAAVGRGVQRASWEPPCEALGGVSGAGWAATPGGWPGMLLGPGPGDSVWLSERPGLRGGLEALPRRTAELTCPAGVAVAAVAATACLWRGPLAAPGPASLGSCWFSFCVPLRGFSGPAPPSRAERASSLLVTLGVRTLCVCGSRAGVWNVTFAALARLLGGTFSFWDRRRTDDLPVTSGDENRKWQFSGLLSPATFSSVKICRLILPARCRAPGPRRRR